MKFSSGCKSKEIILTSLETKIRDLQPQNQIEALIGLLGYLYALLGLKGDRLPDKAETSVIIDFIRNHLGAYTVDEIRLAFQLAAAGKLDEKATHYQNFNCEYIGKIMSSYEQYRRPVFAEFSRNMDELEKHKDDEEWTPEKIKAVNHQFIIECIIKPWKYYLKTGILTFGIHPYKFIYNTLVETGFLNVPNEEKTEIYKRAVKHAELVSKKKTHDKTEFEKLSRLRDLIANIGIERAMEMEIKEICYKICVHNRLEKCKEDKEDVEAFFMDWIEMDKLAQN